MSVLEDSVEGKDTGSKETVLRAESDPGGVPEIATTRNGTLFESACTHSWFSSPTSASLGFRLQASFRPSHWALQRILSSGQASFQVRRSDLPAVEVTFQIRHSASGKLTF